MMDKYLLKSICEVPFRDMMRFAERVHQIWDGMNADMEHEDPDISDMANAIVRAAEEFHQEIREQESVEKAREAAAKQQAAS